MTYLLEISKWCAADGSLYSAFHTKLFDCCSVSCLRTSFLWSFILKVESNCDICRFFFNSFIFLQRTRAIVKDIPRQHQIMATTVSLIHIFNFCFQFLQFLKLMFFQFVSSLFDDRCSYTINLEIGDMEPLLRFSANTSNRSITIQTKLFLIFYKLSIGKCSQLQKFGSSDWMFHLEWSRSIFERDLIRTEKIWYTHHARNESISLLGIECSLIWSPEIFYNIWPTVWKS